MGSLFGQVLVKKRHIFCLESLLTVPIFEVGVDTTWMNDLIRRCQCEIQESWNGDRRNTISKRHGIASIVNLFQGVSGQVEMLFRANDVDLFAIVERLADKRHILQTEQSDVSSQDLSGAPKSALDCPVEGTLAENRAKHAVIWQVVFDISQDLGLSLCGRANDNDI